MTALNQSDGVLCERGEMNIYIYICIDLFGCVFTLAGPTEYTTEC